MSDHKTPCVLVIGGHDPSGAGIQADIEACAALRCHAACVVTAITAQNTRAVSEVAPVVPRLILDQAKRLLEDYSFAACKIGLIPDMGTLEAVCDVLSHFSIPTVVDPVLVAGSGSRLTHRGLSAKLASELLPKATVCTPNLSEARALSSAEDLDEIGAFLNHTGCDYVLMTGADEPTDDVVNYLYYQSLRVAEFRWERLPHRYHGSGCTLAASIAALLSLGLDVVDAIKEGQSFTWHSLRGAADLGTTQRIPNRFINFGKT